MPLKINSNVANRDIILTTKTIYAGGSNIGKVKLLTVGIKFFTVRIIPQGGGLLTLRDKYPITNDKTIYNGRWPTFYKIIEGMDKVLEIHKELYGNND